MKQMAICSICSLIFLFGCAAGPERMASLERQVIDAENRLAHLETYLKTDQASSRENEQGLRDSFAQTRADFDTLAADIQKINGRLDQMEFLLNERSPDKGLAIDEALKASTDRIARLEKHLNLPPLQPAPPVNAQPAPEAGREAGPVPAALQPKPAATVALPEDASAEEVYASARKSFDEKDYETAKVGFEKLLQKYPKSQLSGNSQFWLGEVYFREKWYEKAILEYQKVIENYPNGNKIPSALLKQGLSFQLLGDKDNARLILEELIRKHPKSPEADLAKIKLKDL
jgi:tol-pal system protein YbgF